MNIYVRKRRWKILLFVSAMIIVLLSLWYIDTMAKQIESEQRNKIKLWVNAINKKASLVNATDQFYSLLQEEERKKVKLWADANLYVINAPLNTPDFTIYSEIMAGNNTIPVIITDENNRVMMAKNVDFDPNSVKVLSGKLLSEFSQYPPLAVDYMGKNKNLLFYKDSKIFTGLKEVLEKQVKAFLSEIVTNAPSVPVIVTDSSRHHLIAYGNIDTTNIKDPATVDALINSMVSENNTIKVDLPGEKDCTVFYKDSALLIQLKYFPYVQFLIIFVFLFIAYMLFSTSRRSEQNQVWVGMARETAHQLGTPLSSLIAWVELLRLKGIEEENLTEVTKDIKRLETITERFSKIGSEPKLVETEIVVLISNAIDYLRKRTSKKITYAIISSSPQIIVPVNHYLFEWVIENVCKNAIDAMSGNGSIEIEITEEAKQVHIDISDTGKGLPKSKFKTIFGPGYTSKKTGWGLGLTLSERIIKNYHKGRIFVRSSQIGKGTTFRISLKK